MTYIYEIINISIYWQVSTRFGAPQIGPETTIYHKWRPKGIVNISKVGREKDRPQHIGFTIISKNQ